MDKCKVCGCTDDHACPGGCYWVVPGLCSVCASKIVDVEVKKEIEGAPREPGEPDPVGIFTPDAFTEKLHRAVFGDPRRRILVSPGKVFTTGGIAYKVSGDGSFHHLTEPKPSRKAWKRQQVMERKAERERKRRVKEW